MSTETKSKLNELRDTCHKLHTECDKFEESIKEYQTTQAHYILDLGGYNNTFLINKKAMNYLLSSLDELQRVDLTRLDTQRNYKDPSSGITIMRKNTSDNVSIIQHKAGDVYWVDKSVKLPDYMELRQSISSIEDIEGDTDGSQE